MDAQLFEKLFRGYQISPETRQLIEAWYDALSKQNQDMFYEFKDWPTVSMEPSLLDIYLWKSVWSYQSHPMVKRVHCIILRLPERQRDCVSRYFYQGMTLDDIAIEMSVSIRTVRTHLNRGINEIKSRLGVKNV